MGDLPKNWVETEIGIVGEVITGNTPSKKHSEYYDGEIPWIKPGDIRTGVELFNSVETLTEEGSKNARMLPKGAVMVTCIGDLGNIAIAGTKMATNQQINSVVFSQYVDDKFGYYACNLLEPWLIQNSTSTTISMVNKSKFSKAPFPLPPLPEQQRIVAKLDTLFGHLDSLKQRLELIPSLLKQFRQSVLTQAVTGKLTEKWREGKELGEWDTISISEVSKLNPRYFVEDDVVVGFTPMKDLGKKLFYDISYQNKLFGEVKKGYRRFVEGDVLLAKITPCFENGKSTVVKGLIHPIACGSSEYFVFKCDEVLLPEFLLIYFKRSQFLSEGSRNMSGSVGHKRVTKDFLLDYVIELPIISEQTEIVKRVKALFSKADTIEAAYDKLKQQIDNLPQAILAKAFKGELVEQLPTDGVAKALLKEIAALRASLEKEKKSKKKKKVTV